ncbi:phosphonatase-like hydrolase [Pedobacter sp. UYEF25]
MPIKLVVFDMAGTTVKDPNEVTNTFRSSLEKFGYFISNEMINPLMGYEKKVAITKMLQDVEPDPAKITSELISGIHQEFVKLMIQHYQQTPLIEALPNAEQTMQQLKARGIKIGINTGFSKNIADTIIERLQWREKGLFDYLIGSDEVPNGRPDPAMIHQMMHLANLTDAQEVAKVGDTEVDVREGQNAGCKYVIAVTTGAFSRLQLEPYKPTHIIDDIADVISIII